MKTVLIPVELCEYVLMHKLSKPFQLYMLLKSICYGQMKIDKQFHKLLAARLGLKSEKTIKNNLKILLDLNFIGHNPNSGYYFIRGFHWVQSKLKLTARTAAEFDYADIDKLQAFCMAAVTCYIVKQQKRKWLSEQDKGCSNHDNHLSSAFYVSSTLLRDKLGISLNTAYRLKKKAHETGFLEIIPNWEPLNQDARFKRSYLKGWPENKNILRVRDGMLFLQRSDQIIPKVRFKRRKKIETLIRGS